MGSFSIWHWIIVLLIVMMVFGTKRLRTMGNDLGQAVRGFKEGLKEGEADNKESKDASSKKDIATIDVPSKDLH